MNAKFFFSSVKTAFSREIKMISGVEFFFNTILLPLLYIGLFGLLMGRLIPKVTFRGEELSYLTFMFPGILVSICFNEGIRGGNSLFREKLNGGLETLFSLPVPRSSLFLAKVLTACFKALASMVVVSILGFFLVKGMSITVLGIIGALLAALCIAIAFTSIMIALISLTRHPDTPLAIGGLMLMPLTMLSTIFYPEEVFQGLPLLDVIVKINPVSHAALLMRSFIFSYPLQFPTSLVSGLYLVGLVATGLIIGNWAFGRTLEE